MDGVHLAALLAVTLASLLVTTLLLPTNLPPADYDGGGGGNGEITPLAEVLLL